ncbi:MAG: calcium-binding protein [Solirubrobacterales bacterium]
MNRVRLAILLGAAGVLAIAGPATGQGVSDGGEAEGAGGQRQPIALQDPPMCRGRAVTITGSDKNDDLPHITGTAGADVIAAGNGNDIVFAKGSDDVVCGGPGRDEIIGGRGEDVLAGEGGGDFLFGSGDKDKLLGGKGGDFLKGGKGKDTLKGGRGKDREVR